MYWLQYHLGIAGTLCPAELHFCVFAFSEKASSFVFAKPQSCPDQRILILIGKYWRRGSQR